MNKKMKNPWLILYVLTCFLISSALSLSSCSSGGGSGQSGPSNEPSIIQSEAKIIIDTSVPSPGTGNIAHIEDIQNFLVADGSAEGQYYNIVYWGTKDSTGKPTSVTQALVYQTDPAQGVRVFFDSNALPIVLKDENSGNTTFITYSTTSAIFTSYDASGVLLSQKMVSQQEASLVVTSSAPTLQKNKSMRTDVVDPIDAAFARHLIATFFGEVGSKLITAGLVGSLLGVSMPAFVIGGAIGLTGYVLLEIANIVAAAQDENVANYLNNLMQPDAVTIALQKVYTWVKSAVTTNINPSENILPEIEPTPPATINDPPVISPGNLSLSLGQTANLTAATASGLDITNVVQWTSSDSAVATIGVMGNGVPGQVTAIGPGTATITATILHSNISASVTVTVTSSSGSGGTYSISGTVTHFGGWGLGNVFVYLVSQDSTTLGGSWTDSNGNYTLWANNGNYNVIPNLSGYTFNPAKSALNVNGANIAGVNFITTADWTRVHSDYYIYAPCSTGNMTSLLPYFVCYGDAYSEQDAGKCCWSDICGTVSVDGTISINGTYYFQDATYPLITVTRNLTFNGKFIGWVIVSSGMNNLYYPTAQGTFSYEEVDTHGNGTSDTYTCVGNWSQNL